MADPVQDLIAYVRDQRMRLALPDAAFAATAGIGVDELAAFEAGAADVPAPALGAMLGALAVMSRDGVTAGDLPPGLSEVATPFLRSAPDEKRFAETLELVRAFSAITCSEARQRVLDLALASAARSSAKE